jgi:hypothetical protein
MLWEKHCAKRSVISLTADTPHAKDAALKASLEAAGVKFTNGKRYFLVLLKRREIRCVGHHVTPLVCCQ